MAPCTIPFSETIVCVHSPSLQTNMERSSFFPYNTWNVSFSKKVFCSLAVHSLPSSHCTFPRRIYSVNGKNKKKRISIFCALSDGHYGGGTNDFDRTKIRTRRELLMEYVKNVQPEFMERFMQRTPEQVVEAMRQTVTNMLGTLPPQFFEITVTTVGENLAQLMYSVMMTGYMFRNAQYRVELSQTLAPALPSSTASVALDSNYEPGVQKTRVRGEVLRWHKEEGPVAMDAVEYIESLENELMELKTQLERESKNINGKNKLLEYLKTLEPQNLQELTASAGDDALEAMNAFIHRLLGVSDSEDLKKASSETTAVELAKLLFWLMVVGYSIRNIEVRFDMEKILSSPPKLAELPPGEI